MVAELPSISTFALMLDALPFVEVQTLMQSYGLSVLFGMIVLESIGIPIPSETALVTAAVFAGSTHQLGPVWVILVAAVAAVFGYSLGYAIGRSIGLRLIARYARHLRLSEARLKVGQYLFCATGERSSSSGGSFHSSGLLRRSWSART